MNPAYKLVNSIANNITLPEVYRRIRVLIVTPDSKIEDYVAVIQTDPALALRLINITNSSFFGYMDSSFYGYVRKADTLKKAIAFIGIMQLHDILLSTLVIRAFSGIPDHIINLQSFWHSAVFSGIAARIIAKKYSLPASERMFTSGLLHEIGHIVMYAKAPEIAQDSLMESEQFTKPLVIVQREKLGFDYAELGYELMRIWHLPESYQQITANHAEPEKALEFKTETAIVNLARKITLAEDLGTEFSLDQLPTFPKPNKNIILSKDDIDEITIQGRFYVDEVLNLLWPFSQTANIL